MQLAIPTLFAALVTGQTFPVSYQTANFVVEAATPEVAQLVAESAERYRRELARVWLEKDMPDWPAPCRVHVTLNADRPAGRTDISFARGQVVAQYVDVRGSLDRVLKGPLPHEITHVLFAHFFGAQPPRWADEGAAIISEDGIQGERQRQLFRKILADESYFSLRRLLAMRAYPEDLTCLYAQGYSVSRFLITAKSRKTFVAFVRDGLDRGWDDAARNQYGYQTVEDMEKAWLGWASRQSDNRGAVVQERPAQQSFSSLGQ
jgi:hypothetical protein